MEKEKVITVLLYNEVYQNHLNKVKAEMLTLGAPTVHAVWVECCNAYLALDASHRLTAAHELGLAPRIIVVNYDEEKEHEVRDIIRLSPESEEYEHYGDITLEWAADKACGSVQLQFRV